MVLMGLQHYALAYMDDVVIFSIGCEDHIEHVKYVLSKFLDAGLTLNLDKCEYRATCTYLCHTVGHGKISPSVRTTGCAVDRGNEEGV